jgi:hypothetical protein
VATDSSVAITAGTGTPIDAIVLAGGDYQQVVRVARCSAVTHDDWAHSTTARPTPIAADDARIFVFLQNESDWDVRLRFDATNPTSTTGILLRSGSTWSLEPELTTVNIRMISMGATGTLHAILGTKA